MPFETIDPPNAAAGVRVSWEAGVTVVTVSGEMDLAHEPLFTTELLRARGSSRAVLVDLGGCAFLDSVGLSALLSCVRAAEAAGVGFCHSLFASSDDGASGLVALRGGV